MSNKTKQLLAELVIETHKTLNLYIGTHNQRLQTAGTFISLFRKPNFKSINTMAHFALDQADQLCKRVNSIEASSDWEEGEELLLTAIKDYALSLHQTCLKLCALTKNQYLIADGQKKANWNEDKQLTADYQLSIDNYMNYGSILNKLYKVVLN